MIVVTGATGNVGRALVDRLTAEGRPVRALTRDPGRAELPAGAEVARLDLSRPAALFDGASKPSRLFLHVQATGDRTEAVLDAARTAGVQHVVMLSSGIIKEGADETHPIHAWHAGIEKLVRNSGLTWTFLRPNAFSVNAFQWAPQIRAGDTVRGPFEGALSAPVHEHDIAAVAAHALLDDGHAGAVHRITGPEAVTTGEQIAAIGRAVGRDLRFVEIPPHEAGKLFPHVPPEMLQPLLKSFEASVGVPPEITTTVETVTGIPARTFATWAEDHRDDFTA
ncbi:SDR family oxidoreductase [Streptomyces sp. NPDC058371]|uniref:SDR family oxidoreductase n=1 Tax=Streptomyces sp. NPDC058371 TaxID=3346463 RepID=UPI00366813EC